MFGYQSTRDEFSADNWLNGWYKALEKSKDEPVYADDQETLTGSQVEELSGKVYAYLKQQGIGKEDFVLILLPRGARVFVAMLGIVKAGAAYVVVEEGYPSERTEFIRNDVNCKLILDAACYQEIVEQSVYLEGFEPADDHDAAYAVYTSGTTGTPKGIIHERGSMFMSFQSSFMEEDRMPDDNSRFAVLAPLNFSATMLIFNTLGNLGGLLYIPSYDTIKNPKKLMAAFAEKEIGATFMAPSMMASVSSLLPQSLTCVVTGSASADGVWAGEGKNTWNFYMASETCFVIAMYQILQPTTPCPAGKPNPGIESWIAEDGQVVVKTPFCRGYIGGETGDKPAFRDGCYYTGDIGHYDDEGNIILEGRLSDMVKINGNRIEPAEVEAAFSAVTGLDCVAKGFESREDSFISLYYVPDAQGNINTETIVARLSEILPYYMIPSFFVPISQIPRTNLGKIDRKALAKPRAEHRPYIAPRTDLEKELCALTAKILDCEKVGVADDFFELGGTSLDVIEAVAELNLAGLTATEFYQNRTIGAIAEAYQRILDNSSAALMTEEEKELEARKKRWPITKGFYMFYMFLQAPQSTNIVNLSSALQLTKLANLEKLRDAINTYTSTSSTFQTIIEIDENHRGYYRYAPELYKPVEIEEMSEEEFEEVRQNFVQPFNILEELPWRIRLIKTNKHNYLLMDVHHLLTDGAGMGLMAQDIAKIYLGKKPNTNNLYAFMYDEEQEKHTEFYHKSRAYQKQHLDAPGLSGQVREPSEDYGARAPEIVSGVSLKKMNAYLKKNNLSRDEFFLAAHILAIAPFQKTPNFIVPMMFENRLGATNSAGLPFVTAGVTFDMTTISSLEILMKAVCAERQRTIAMSCYSIIDANETEYSVTSAVIDDLGDLENVPPLLQKLAKQIELPRPPVPENPNPMDTPVIINYINRGDDLVFRPYYDIRFLSDAKIEKVLADEVDVMQRIMAGDESVVKEYNKFAQ